MNLERLMSTLSGWSWRHARGVLVAALAVVVASPFVLSQVVLDTDSSRLLAVNDPLARAHRSARELFGETSPLLLLVDRGDSDVAAYDRFCTRLGDELSGWPDLRLVVYRLPDMVHADELAAELRRAVWRASPATIGTLTGRFDGEGMRRQLLRSRKRLVVVDDPMTRRRVQSDILAVLEELVPAPGASTSGLELSPDSGFVQSLDGDHRLVWIQPTGSGEDSTYCEELGGRLKRLVDRLHDELPDARGVSVASSGVHAITAESARLLKRQMVVISLVSASLLLALMWFAFRSLRVTLLAIAPLVVAQLITLMVAVWAFDAVFAWSVGFVAIAMGLGLDVALHLVARTLQIRGGLGEERAVTAAMVDSGPPVTVGVLSTAAAFLAVLLADSPGLDQFAILTVVGLISSLLVTLVMFPALTRLLTPGGRGSRRAGMTARWSVRLFGVIAGGRRWPALAALAVLLLGLPLASERKLDLHIRHLVPTGLASVHTGERIVELFGGSFLLTSQLLVRAPSLELAAAGQEAVDRHLARMVTAGRIAGYRSPRDELADQLPPSPGMTEAVALLHDRIVDSRDRFFILLDELGFVEAPAHERYWEALQEATRPVEANSTAALSEAPPSGLSVAVGPDGVSVQTAVWPADQPGDSLNELDLEPILAVSEELRGIVVPPPATITVVGIAEVYAEVSGMVRGDLERISAVGAGLVCLVVLFFLRNLADGLRCLVPLLAALPTAAAAAMVLHVPLAQTAPCLVAIVVGIGIDDAVHVVHRVRRGAAVAEVLREIGPVLSLTTASTVIGFGCLSFSSLEVLSSMGLNVALGVAACWFFTIFLLPATWRRAPRGAVTGVLMLLLATSSSAAQPRSADELLDELVRRAAGSEAVSCEVDQTKELAALSRPVHLEGSVLFMQPAFLRVELSGDESFAVFSDGDTLWFVDRDLDEVEEMAVIDRKAIARLLPGIALPDLSAERDDFVISLVDGDGAQHALRFEPRATARWPFRSAVIELDDQLRITRTVVELANGDRVTTRFAKWRRHEHISPLAFVYRREVD